MAKRSHDELVRELSSRLSALKRQCELFDSGSSEAAIEISGILRVLFIKGRYPPLIELLSCSESVQLISTFPKNITSKISKPVFSLPLMMTSEGPKYDFDFQRSELASIEEWLDEETIILNEYSYSRKTLIEFTANKFGASHVAKDINPKQRNMIQSFGIVSCSINGRRIANDLNNMHYIVLRRMAQEILLSEQLFKTTGLIYEKPIARPQYKELMSIGDKLKDEKRPSKAIDAYKEVVKYYSDICEDALSKIGECWENIGEIEDAKKYFLSALEINSSHYTSLSHLGRIFYHEREYEQCLDILDKSSNLEVLKDQPAEVRNEFTKCIDKNRMMIFQEIVEGDEFSISQEDIEKINNVSYLGFIAYKSIFDLNYHQAISLYSRGLELESQKDDFIMNALLCCNKCNDREKGLELIQYALSRDDICMGIALCLAEYSLVNNINFDARVVEVLADESCDIESEKNLANIFMLLYKSRELELNSAELDSLKILVDKSGFDFEDIITWLDSSGKKYIHKLFLSEGVE